ncbi:hypothetical protein BDB00DRAFT_756810 [Zychaea mexicana]|uniref:uncharacterized protein n=1 Tax=Zychaea mexicana TaxID=64656 RepID=UPI0022FE647F|nr:uncharacterized protein BDB00DRAFT_756810 [Zychaea mexicana]KAI9497353.1 hypothetical protein BDB00DRAFT_756810 [Zychaea mexicana]
MFVLDGPEQAAAFYPLMCRFGYTVHAVVSGAERGLSGSTLEKTLKDTGCGRRVVVHDLDVMVSAEEGTSATEVAMGIARLVRVLRPRALFHVLRDQPLSHALETMADNEKITAIGLPADDVVHALWISDLPLEALEQWHTPDINLVVITDRRPHSLSRLLQSAERSFYLGDKVNLVVHLEQSSDPVTRMLVNNFPWRHGKKILRHRMRKGGLMPAIIESWYPKHINDYAVILEDDVEVSPLFYVWSKYSILQYRYTHAVDDQLRRTMYGVSLYSPRSLELHPPGRRPFHPDNVLLNHYPPRMPYVSQVPCSWGAVYFPEHWREFHEYLTIRLMDMNQDKLLNVTVPQSRSARWKKSWKKYFIELVYLRAYVMLYPNFQEFESFSTNHLETGTHVKTTAKRLNSINAFLVPLMQRDTILAQLPNHRLPEYDDLPVLDLWGYLKTHDELDETAAQWHTRISTCPRTTGTFDPKDLLCPFPPPEEPVPEPPKKPKKIKTAYAVEPIEYVTMYYNTHGSQQAKEELVAIDHNNDDDLPGPINVARMPSAPDDGSNLWDDHWLDLLSELDLMNQLYTRMNPEDLRDVLAADAELDLD